MVVIDTNVLVHLLIDSERTREARLLYARDGDWRSERFILIELTNVLTTAVRVRGLRPASADSLLGEAERILGPGLHEIPNRAALEVAQRYSISAYDARFVAMAQQLGSPLVTEDAKLRHSVRDYSLSLAEWLRKAR